MSQVVTQEFDWAGELHKTVVQSLTTTFSLDFLFFEDKVGGDVDTIHNVRQGVYATEEEKQKYEQRGDYNSANYHGNAAYRAKGKSDKQKQQAGELHDHYRNQTMGKNENRQLDHTISAHEIHDDPGRVLAEMSGVDLANQDSNLNSTHAYINNLKRDKPVDKFLNETVPKQTASLEKSIATDQNKLSQMPSSTPQERHAKKQMEDKIRKNQENLEALKSIDKDEMLEADKKAREEYNVRLNKKYYGGSNFLKSTGYAAGKAGLNMGKRQALGLLLAEVWFELREQIPVIVRKCRDDFQLSVFFESIVDALKNIFERVKKRFQDIVSAFRDGFLSGILSSITTTILNIFLTSGKLAIKMIREMWSTLVQVIKLVFFNPDKLAHGELLQKCLQLLSFGVASFLGVMLNQTLNQVMKFPFGTELAAFLSALATGIMTLGLTYVLNYSKIMQKVWQFLNSVKSQSELTLEYYKKVNAELDRYVTELAKLEFNMDTNELQYFNDKLILANSEYERSILLGMEIQKRGIELPFEHGDKASVRHWLQQCQKN